MKATRFTRLLLAASFTLLVTTGVALANDAFKTVQTDKGAVLADVKGMTLYTFDKDAGGKSICNGPCAANWPPHSADVYALAEGKFTIVRRDDGSRQWVVDGKPVYRWKNDQKPGDTTGDGLNGVWHIAKP
jgi:predicted lipoprotein with Yx(FWY)xxD motif